MQRGRKGRSTKRVRFAHREPMVWQPRWEPEIKGWAAKTIKKNIWRYDHLHSFEDLMQDAYVCFLVCCERYPRVVEAPHFMALFKTTLRNFLCDRSIYNIRKKAITVDLEGDALEFADMLIGDLDNGGYLAVLLHEAPPEIKAALEVFMNEEYLHELQKPIRTEPKGLCYRETLNDRLCRLTGIDRSHDLVSGIQSWLQSAITMPQGR